jgi:signal transduction histidine kinase
VARTSSVVAPILPTRLPGGAPWPRPGNPLLRFLCAWLVAGAIPTIGLPAVLQTVTRNVLVVHGNSRLLPADIEASTALQQTITTTAGPPVVLFDEFLDQPRFHGQAYEDTFLAYMREKYAERKPEVIVAAGEDALRFLLRNRSRAFSDVPIVHLAVSREFLRSHAPVPPDVIGVPGELDFFSTAEQALRWHPKTRILVIVTGASPWDRDWERRAREEGARLQGRVKIEALSGLSTAMVLQRLAELGDDAVVFTPGYFEDGDHRVFAPRDTIAAMAAASRAPIYGPFNTHLGLGIVGGYSWRFEDAGIRAAQIVNELLAGTPTSALRLPDAMPTTLNVDWRQMRRWGIDGKELPPGTVVHFKVPTFLDEHGGTVAIATVGFLLQAGLIAWLLLERTRRRRAERTAQMQANSLAHASRVALAGELTGAIAHEINQPLGAILSNAEAAELILDSGSDRRGELREILADIRRDDQRASDVIRRLRSLLAKHEVERAPFGFGEALADLHSTLAAEARRRRVTLIVRPTSTDATVIGDRVQVQQVLMNLVLNAMDAVAGLPEDRRRVVVTTDIAQDRIAVTVRDRGRGVAPEHMPRLFDSFFTTKPTGMGLGLSIAQTLVRAHGGRIWAESVAGEGAVFHLELPVASAKGSLSPEPA